VIATTTAGLAETVTEPLTSHADQPGRPPSLAATIRRALSRRPSEHARMLAEGLLLTGGRYDHDAQRAGVAHRARTVGDHRP
jgi:hypothetical protein